MRFRKLTSTVKKQSNKKAKMSSERADMNKTTV